MKIVEGESRGRHAGGGLKKNRMPHNGGMVVEGDAENEREGERRRKGPKPGTSPKKKN